MINRKATPTIKDAIEYEYYLSNIENITCKNNIPLYILNAGTQDVVQIEWIFEAGIWHEPKKAVAQTVGVLLKNGTTNKSELAINEELEYYGTSLRINVNNDYTTVSLHCLTKHLSHILPIIYEIITEATFPESELNIYKKNALQALSVRKLNADFIANRHIEALLFGYEHPYGRYTEEEDIEALSREDLIQFHKNYYSYNNCKIFISGKFEESHLNLVQEIFGNTYWNESIVNNVSFATGIQASDNKDFKLINNPDGVQGAIRLGLQFIDKKHPDFVPTQVLNTVLGGYFSSRFMNNIREEKGYTYGIYSYVAAYKNASMLIITSEVGRDVVQHTLEEINKEMSILRNELIDEDELLLVKNYILGGVLGDLEGPFSIMRFWKNLILNNESIEDFNYRIDTIKNINSETLQALAHKYLNYEMFYKVTVV